MLRAYRRWGPACVDRLRGMFAFAIWDEAEEQLFCARDRFGIKPFAFALHDGVFYGASEAKALLPFLPAIETDLEALKDYLAFQFCLAGKTLFKGVRELLPGHTLTIRKGAVHERRYWEVEYEPDFDHREGWLTDRLRELVEESVEFHLRADVPVGAYLSGGLDSSITTSLAARGRGTGLPGVHRDASPTASATTRPATRACSPTSAASGSTSRRSAPPTSPRTSATSSTTSTTRSQAPGRSRSTWSRGSPRST